MDQLSFQLQVDQDAIRFRTYAEKQIWSFKDDYITGINIFVTKAGLKEAPNHYIPFLDMMILRMSKNKDIFLKRDSTYGHFQGPQMFVSYLTS